MSKDFVAKTYLKCDVCSDIICSSYSGEYVRCSCDAIGVDETFYYCRIIGGKWKSVDKPKES